jgi:hypothetical protein
VGEGGGPVTMAHERRSRVTAGWREAEEGESK